MGIGNYRFKPIRLTKANFEVGIVPEKNKYYKCEALDFLSLLDRPVDLILTDPMYDWSYEKKLKYLTSMMFRSRRGVIIFSPPENLWSADLPSPENWPSYTDFHLEYAFWIKPTSTKNTTKSYARFVEVVEFFEKGSWIFNQDLPWANRNNTFFDIVDKPNHPFRKPYSLIQRLILNHTLPGDTVLDCFAGSGVVGEVCQDLGNRDFYLCDDFSLEST